MMIVNRDLRQTSVTMPPVPAGPSTVSPSKSPSRSRCSMTSGTIGDAGRARACGVLPAVWAFATPAQKRFPVLAMRIVLNPGVDRLRPTLGSVVGMAVSACAGDLLRRPVLGQAAPHRLVHLRIVHLPHQRSFPPPPL